MLCVTLCANGDAEIGDGLPFVEFCILLQSVLFVNGADTAVKIAFQCGKPDFKAETAHFYIAFAKCPKTAECFVGVGGHEDSRMLLHGKEAVCHRHDLVGLADLLDIDAAGDVGNGANGDISAVGKVEMDFGMLGKVGLSVLIHSDLDVFKTVSVFQRRADEKLTCEQGSLGFRALDGFDALLFFFGNFGNAGVYDLFRIKIGKICVICVCVRHESAFLFCFFVSIT